MNTPTYITIVSTHGVIRVDRQTGKVIGRRISTEYKPALQYHTAYQFDLDEYFAWDKGSDRETCEHIDICGIKYTYLDKDGASVVDNSVEGWREDVEEARNEAVMQEIAWNESTLDTCACELLSHVTPETAKLWTAFSKAMQADLKTKFGENVFENF